MVEADVIAGWCTAAGHLVSGGPDEQVLSLGGAEGRISPGGGDDPLRFLLFVRLGDGLPGPAELEGLLAAVSISRGPLVDVRLGSGGAGGEATAEVCVSIYPDGITRHAVLAALDELSKARYAVEEALQSARQAQALRALLAGPSGAAEADEAAPGPPVQAARATAPVEAAAEMAPVSAAAEIAPVSAAVGETREVVVPEIVPRWCYVEAPAEVHDLAATERVAGHLQPGVWYQALQESGGWLRVRAPEGGLDGWVDASLVRWHEAGR